VAEVKIAKIGGREGEESGDEFLGKLHSAQEGCDVQE